MFRRFFLMLFVMLLMSSLFLSGAKAGDRPRISIPALNLSSSIVEFPLEGGTWTIRPWERAVGHLETTSWFDSPGNIVLAGHVKMPNGKRGIFRKLDQVSIGTDIVVFDGANERHYTVSEVKIVSEYDVSVVYPTPDERLTLITCDVNSYDPATQTYSNRLVVVAQRVN